MPITKPLNSPSERIPLYNFKYIHGSFNKGAEDGLFIGRKTQEDKFIGILNGVIGGDTSGAYLIAGHRGAGKTSFVNHCLNKYSKSKKNKENLLKIKVNLGNESNLSSRQVMLNMVSLLENKIDNKLKADRPVIIFFTLLFFSIAIALISSLYFGQKLFTIVNDVATQNFKFFINLYQNSLSYFNSLDPIYFWIAILIGVFGATFALRPQLKNILLALVYSILILSILVFVVSAVINILSLESNQFNNLLSLRWLSLVIPIVIGVVYFLTKFIQKSLCFGVRDLLCGLTKLKNEIISTQTTGEGISKLWFSQKVTEPISENQIEQRLTYLLNKFEKYYSIVFIFDELDKITFFFEKGENTQRKMSLEEDIINRMNQINNLLGGLKNLVSSAHSTMIFIAGRELYDAYLAERGNTSSLYESIFNAYIYIPSLMSDASDNNHVVLDSMVESYICSKLYRSSFIEEKVKKENKKEEEKNYNHICKLFYYSEFKGKKEEKDIYILKIFIHFLTLYSWGNMKRLSTLFESFVYENTGKGEHKYELVFSIKDLQRLVFASQLYIPFHQNLSRTLTQADDKLVVSSFAVFHYLLKFHSMSFSKSNVNRMYEALNVHSSTELSSIVDIIINKVLRSQIRRIRNSMYRFRFSYVAEQEIHYITTISDYESASFSFSLNAINNVKSHYLCMLNEERKRINVEAGVLNIEQLAELYLIVGSFNYWERAYDEANMYFGYSEKILHGELSTNEVSLTAPLNHSALMLYIESLLKRGSVAERNGNYTLAASVYTDAYQYIQNISLPNINDNKDQTIKCSDSKWDLLKQPYWAMLYLNLKRSPSGYRKKSQLPEFKFEKNDVYCYQLGTYFSFIENYQEAVKSYMNAVNYSNVLNESRERSGFLGGNALIKAGMSLVSGMSSTVQKGLYEKEDNGEEAAKLQNYFIESFAKYRKSTSNEVDVFHVLKKNTENLLKDKTFFEKENRFTSEIVIESSSTEELPSLDDALGLILLGSKKLENQQLYALAAQGYLIALMITNLYQEMIPLKLLTKKDDKDDKDDNLRIYYNAVIDECLEKAFYCQGMSTTKSFSHSMKTLWIKDFGGKSEEYELITPKLLRETNNKNYSFQQWHYSGFGQLTLALFYWTDLTTKMAMGELKEAKIKDISLEKILPFSERYYSIMLWVKGRYDLYDTIDSNEKKSKKEIKNTALNSAINLYRSSQYISQLSSNEQNIILPPQFLIYYHQWELVHALRGLLGSKHAVKDVMTKLLENEKKASDVSARIFDYDLVKSQALDAFKTVENMGDINSKGRKEVFTNTYYLDDDYEDLIFTLDWTYCHAMGPTAIICRNIINQLSRDVEEKEERLKAYCESINIILNFHPTKG